MCPHSLIVQRRSKVDAHHFFSDAIVRICESLRSFCSRGTVPVLVCAVKQSNRFTVNLT